MAKKGRANSKEKLRIKVKAYDTKLIDNSVKQIEAIKRQAAK